MPYSYDASATSAMRKGYTSATTNVFTRQLERFKMPRQANAAWAAYTTEVEKEEMRCYFKIANYLATD